MTPGGSSGNAIVVNPERSYAVHWNPPDNPHPRYFTMHRLELPGLVVVASEVIAALAPADQWRPLPPNSITVLPAHGSTEGDAHHVHDHHQLAAHRA